MMEQMKPVAVSEPRIVRGYFAEVPVRLDDPGKWSDTPLARTLVGQGSVLNFSGYLRPHGEKSQFKGLQVFAHIGESRSSEAGKIIVSAGSDPKFDCFADRQALAAGDFNKRELPLAVLSLLDFSRIPAGDIHLSISSPIGPGASLGTSAATSVAILRAFLGSDYPADEIARMAVFVEDKILCVKTGNQDQIAATQGSSLKPSACQYIRIEDLYAFSVSPEVVGNNVRRLFETAVVVYLGGHNSSDIHQMVGDKLRENEKLATDKLRNIGMTAALMAEALRLDNVDLFTKVLSQLKTCQMDLHPDLINSVAEEIILETRESSGICVTGAGGRGGSLIVHFYNPGGRDRFAANFLAKYQNLDYRLFDVRLADEPKSP